MRPVAWRWSWLCTPMYFYICAAIVAMEVGLLDFGIFGQKGFFRWMMRLEAGVGLAKGLTCEVQCELLGCCWLGRGFD